MFKLGMFRSHSGKTLPFKIECDDLSNEDWECLAWIVTNNVRPFGSVEGIPRGGEYLANVLQQYVTKGPLLIVDDVYTTGKSMEEQRNKRNAKGAVIFARTTPPDWIKAVFILNSRS